MDPRYSNYPRAGTGYGTAGSGQGQRPPGAHFEFISDAFNIIRADLGTWIVAVLITIVLTIVAISPFYALMFATMMTTTTRSSVGPGGASAGFYSGVQGFAGVGVALLIYVAIFAISLFTYVGIASMGMQAARGQRPQLGDLFAPFRRVVPVFATCLIVAVLMFVGFAFFILPGLIVIGLFSLAPLAAYEQQLSPGEALKWSLEASRPHMWGIMGLSIVASLIASLGGCLCYVGYLFTGAVPGIVLGLTYLSFRYVAPAATPFLAYPPTGPVAPPTAGDAPPPPSGL